MQPALFTLYFSHLDVWLASTDLQFFEGKTFSFISCRLPENLEKVQVGHVSPKTDFYFSVLRLNKDARCRNYIAERKDMETVC